MVPLCRDLEREAAHERGGYFRTRTLVLDGGGPLREEPYGPRRSARSSPPEGSRDAPGIEHCERMLPFTADVSSSAGGLAAT